MVMLSVTFSELQGRVGRLFPWCQKKEKMVVYLRHHIRWLVSSPCYDSLSMMIVMVSLPVSFSRCSVTLLACCSLPRRWF